MPLSAAGGGTRLVLGKDISSMLDVIYLLIGAAFLGACVLYAHACDHL
jgi:hypothetical protein